MEHEYLVLRTIVSSGVMIVIVRDDCLLSDHKSEVLYRGSYEDAEQYRNDVKEAVIEPIQITPDDFDPDLGAYVYTIEF